MTYKARTIKGSFGSGFYDPPLQPTPVNATCVWCNEQILEGEDGVIWTDGEDEFAEHRECNLRQLLGSVAHQEKRCSCFGGTGDDDDEFATRREAARAAVRKYFPDESTL